VTYVDQAAKVVAKNGPSCETFSTSKWTAGDYYIFVIGPDNRIVCHLSPAEIGRATSELADFNGRGIGDAFVAAASGVEGHGWVDYAWPRPGMKTPSSKSAFVKSVTGPDGKRYIVGGGGYGL
jgi:signal transduction histidine kinase